MSAKCQGYDRRNAGGPLYRVIWNIRRQNMRVRFSDVTVVTIHGTPL